MQNLSAPCSRSSFLHTLAPVLRAASAATAITARQESSSLSDQLATERTLYGFWLSPYMSQVAHILSEADLTYRYERVSPYQGSTHTPEHKARNPLAKIPT